MRAHPIHRAPIRVAVSFGFILVAGIAASFAACADAVHLDPPGAVPDGGATTSTGSGAGLCHSNPDCAFPKPVCDTVSNKCVQCLILSDCSVMPGTVCSKGVCECPSTSPSTPLSYCAGETPACVDILTSDTNCGACGTVCPTGCVKGKCPAPTTSSSTGVGGAGGSGTGGVGGSGTGGSGVGGADGG